MTTLLPESLTEYFCFLKLLYQYSQIVKRIESNHTTDKRDV